MRVSHLVSKALKAMEDPEGAQASEHLIGSPGSNYIANALSTHKSLEAAIADVHARGALGKYSRSVLWAG